MQHAELMAWRKNLRRELLAHRQAVPADQLHAWRIAIDQHLQYGFPGLANGVVAFCWPIQNEYDARFLVRHLRELGATAARKMVQRARFLCNRCRCGEARPGIGLAPI